MKKFWLGFAACYVLAGISQGLSAYEIPATTTAGAVYVGAIWLPFNFLPKKVAYAMIPEWAFDFNQPKD